MAASPGEGQLLLRWISGDVDNTSNTRLQIGGVEFKKKALESLLQLLEDDDKAATLVFIFHLCRLAPRKRTRSRTRPGLQFELRLPLQHYSHSSLISIMFRRLRTSTPQWSLVSAATAIEPARCQSEIEANGDGHVFGFFMLIQAMSTDENE